MNLSFRVLSELVLVPALLAVLCPEPRAQGGEPECPGGCTRPNDTFPETVKDACDKTLGELTHNLCCINNGDDCDVVGSITWCYSVAGIAAQASACDNTECDRWYCDHVANGGSRSSSPTKVIGFTCTTPPACDAHDHGQAIPCDTNKFFDAIIWNQAGSCLLGGAYVEFRCS